MEERKQEGKLEDVKSFTVNTLQLSSNAGSGLQANFRTQNPQAMLFPSHQIRH
jgi:hypothetical protein